MQNRFMWRMVAAFAFAVTLICNGLAGGTTLLNGRDTAAVSAAYPTLFTPAGYTFAIWALIYGLVAAYVLYQLGYFGKITNDKQKVVDSITPSFIALSLANTAWIFAWQYDVIWLSLLLIICMLVLLIRINETLRGQTYSTREFAVLRAPFAVYFGWLTVATVANACVWLVSIDWNGWGIDPAVWLIVVLWTAAAIGVVTTLRNKDWAYGLVFVWAYVGIMLAREQPSVAVLANLAFLIAVLAFASGYVLRIPPRDKRGLFAMMFKRFKR